MRIISKFSDYYDAVQAQGQDRSMVFVREQQQFTRCHSNKELTPALAQFVDFAARHTPANLRLSPEKREYLSVEVEFGLVLFAGRLYPYAELRRLPRALGSWVEPYFIYSHDELARVLDEYDFDLAKRDKRAEQWEARFNAASHLNNKGGSSAEFFALTGSDRLMELAMSERLATARWARRMDLLDVNPRLADLQFYRQLDAWQAFQELSMYWGNLAAPDRVPVVIEDKYRIVQHGFDKYSFRKPPQSR